jgi:hypothetical protein
VCFTGIIIWSGIPFTLLENQKYYIRTYKKSSKIPKGGNQNMYIKGEQTNTRAKRLSRKGQTTIYKTYT